MKILFRTLLILLISTVFTPVLCKTAFCKITPDHNFSISGRVDFYQQNETQNTFVDVDISGFLPDTLHGIHVHEFGNITGGCGSSGMHYNPHKVNHGGPNDTIRHIGDMGNLKSDSNGTAILHHQDSNLSLYGNYSIIGKACMVHELEDDLGKGGHADSITTGHAGQRMGCGVIYESEVQSDDLNPWIWPLVLGVTILGALYYYFVHRRNQIKYQAF